MKSRSPDGNPINGRGSHRARRGAVVARQAHNLEVSGSNPLAATFIGPTGKPRVCDPRLFPRAARSFSPQAMKVPEHLALSFLMAQLGVQQQYGPGGTALMMLAGFLPDLDAVTALAGWDVYRRWHRRVGHGLPITLL